jgi:hypothetical protein
MYSSSPTSHSQPNTTRRSKQNGTSAAEETTIDSNKLSPTQAQTKSKRQKNENNAASSEEDERLSTDTVTKSGTSTNVLNEIVEKAAPVTGPLQTRIPTNAK